MNNWKNRIVGHEEVSPDSLLANERNWRIHPKEQQDALLKALNVGWIGEIIVNKRTSEQWGRDRGIETVLDGHARIKLALRHDQQSVPVTYVDLTPTEEKQALVFFDRITNMAVQDDAMLAEIVQELLDEEVEIPSMTETDIEILQATISLPDGFPEYDESIADTVDFITCPECGHRWVK